MKDHWLFVVCGKESHKHTQTLTRHKILLRTEAHKLLSISLILHRKISRKDFKGHK